MGRQVEIFNTEEKRFIRRKAIEKFNQAIELEEIQATYLYFGDDVLIPGTNSIPTKEDKKIAQTNETLLEIFKITKTNLEKINKRTYGIFNTDKNLYTPDNSKFKNFINFLGFKKDKPITGFKEPIYQLLIFILKEELGGLQPNEINPLSSNVQACLANLRSILSTTYHDFPGNRKIFSKYKILIIGTDLDNKKISNDIKNQLNPLKKDIAPKFVDADKFIDEYCRKKSSENIIGAFLIVTDDLLNKQYGFSEGKEGSFRDFLYEWASIEKNEAIPITYICRTHEKETCSSFFSEIGEPVEVIPGTNGSVILNVFLKAIERYRDQQEKLIISTQKVKSLEVDRQNLRKETLNYKEILANKLIEKNNLENENEKLKTEKNNLENNLKSINEETGELKKQNNSFIQEKNNLKVNLEGIKEERNISEEKRKRLISLLIICLSLLAGLLGYFNYWKLNKEVEKPILVRVIEGVGIPFYLKISSDNNYLYISNKTFTDSSNSFFKRINLKNVNEDNKINTTFTTVDFAFVEDYILTNNQDKPTIYYGKIDKNGFIDDVQVPKNDTLIKGTSGDAISLNPTKKKGVATFFNSNTFLAFSINNKNGSIKIKEDTIIKISNFSSFANPSGVSYINKDTFVICLNSFEDNKPKVLFYDENFNKIDEGLENARTLTDIKCIPKLKYCIACSPDKGQVYLLQTSSIGIKNKTKKLVGNPFSFSQGSPIDLDIAPNGKYAVVGHRNFKKFDVIEIPHKTNSISKLELVETYSFDNSVDIQKGNLQSEGIAVDWIEGHVFVAGYDDDTNSGKVYCFHVPELIEMAK